VPGRLIRDAELVDGVVVGVGDVGAAVGIKRLHDEVEQVSVRAGATQKMPRLQMSPTCIGVVVLTDPRQRREARQPVLHLQRDDPGTS
jgi:hypothetical protein